MGKVSYIKCRSTAIKWIKIFLQSNDDKGSAIDARGFRAFIVVNATNIYTILRVSTAIFRHIHFRPTFNYKIKQEESDFRRGLIFLKVYFKCQNRNKTLKVVKRTVNKQLSSGYKVAIWDMRYPQVTKFKKSESYIDSEISENLVSNINFENR